MGCSQGLAFQYNRYRMIQEGLANALRHSGSSRVRVALSQTNGRVRVEIEDWECRFDLQKVDHSRFGLRGIRERTRLFEGTATIDSAPGRGTRVTAELPVVGAASAAEVE
jgi:signal transduction histidine kinase